MERFLKKKEDGFSNVDPMKSSNKNATISRNINSTIHSTQNESIAEIESTSEDGNISSFSNLLPINSSKSIHNSASISEVFEGQTILADVSSINMEESAVSEYIPNSSADLRSLEISKINTSVEAIDLPLNTTKILVPNSKAKSKKHFCIFCQTLQSKISRHFFLKHKKENEVKKALLLPIKSKERLNIISDLRKRGDFLHNTSVSHNSGILIVPRRQQSKVNNSVDDYICCKKCKGFFSKKTLRLQSAPHSKTTIQILLMVGD